MNSLQYSPWLKRKIRKDAPDQLGRPTRALLEEAMATGETAEALDWLDYMLLEVGGIQRLLGTWSWYMVRYDLDRCGHSSWLELVQQSMAHWVATTIGAACQDEAEVQAGERDASLTVCCVSRAVCLHEEEKCYRITLDAAGYDLTWVSGWRALVEAAIRAGQQLRTVALLDEWQKQARLVHDLLCDWVWALMTEIVEMWGEAGLGEIQRATEEPWITARYAAMREMPVAEFMQLSSEALRGHFSGSDRSGSIHVHEEADRYVLSFDVCGSGARMRTGDPTVGSGSRMLPPYGFAVIQGAYDWTWNRANVPAYCSHCAIVNEILPIAWLGHPLRMTEYRENPAQPCRWHIFKQPEDIPVAAYAAVGRTPARTSHQ